MTATRERRIQRIVQVLIFVGLLASPAIGRALGANDLLLLILAGLIPLLWMTLWEDLGFMLGLFFVWGWLIVASLSSVAPGQVDNMLPGLAIPFGWVAYLMVYGPFFLFMKAVDRMRAKIQHSDPPASTLRERE